MNWLPCVDFELGNARALFNRSTTKEEWHGEAQCVAVAVLHTAFVFVVPLEVVNSVVEIEPSRGADF